VPITMTVPAFRNHIAHVIRCRTGKEVAWTNAERMIAMVADILATMKRPDKLFINPPVDSQPVVFASLCSVSIARVAILIF
jgi:hypothetical protein